MFKDRIKKIKELLEKEKLDGVFISSVSNIEYLTGYSNFSKDEREVYILIGKDFQYIITDGRYSEAVVKTVPHLTLFERGHQKTIENLFKKHKKEIISLGIEEDNLTVSEFKVVKKYFKNLKQFSVNYLRSIKTQEELARIEKACQIGDLAFKNILKKIKIGVTEKEIAGELEKIFKENGAQLSFPPIVAFGKNSSIPHHQTGDTILGEKDGQFILIDMGVKYENYCSDMTRTIFLGKPSSKQENIYEVVLEAQQKTVDFINKAIRNSKQIKAKDADRVARDYIKSQGFPTIPHSLGHGIGLEVHEHPSLSPKSKDILRAGMIFSIEPGIYLPKFGGLRIEDLFLLAKSGLKQLTNSAKELLSV